MTSTFRSLSLFKVEQGGLLISQSLFFLPIYSCVFQTKWPNVEARGHAVQEKGKLFLLLCLHLSSHILVGSQKQAVE